MPAGVTNMIGPILIGAVILFALYRRIRRSVGRQKLRPASLAIRVIILILISGLFLSSRAVTMTGLSYAGIGFFLGICLAIYALRHTKFEFTAEGIFYTAHPYIGLTIVVLLVGRIVYRLVQIYPAMQSMAAPPNGPHPIASSLNTPATLAIYFLSIAYYIGHDSGILLKTRSRGSANDP